MTDREDRAMAMLKSCVESHVTREQEWAATVSVRAMLAFADSELERAAKLAALPDAIHTDMWDAGWIAGCSHAAAAIRSLKEG